MLAQKNRIHGRKNFVKTLKNSQILRGRYFNVYYSFNKTNSLKAAVVVSKKVNKKAVYRNKLRRQIYEILRKEYLLKLQNKNLIIVVFNPEILNLSSSDFYKHLNKQLNKIITSS